MSIIQKAVQTQAAARPEPPPAASPAPVSTRGAPVRPTVVAAFAPLATNGFLNLDPGDHAARAELRHLKRSVLKSAFGPVAEPGANILMITSAMPGAGKTFLSANLAQSLAIERDRSALLVDADDTRATISRALGLHGVPGLYDVMHDAGVPLASCCYPSDVPGLEFVPAGARFDDSLELLTSNRARDVIRDLSRAHPSRLVVVDCPPLLGTPNGAALAALAGQILVVVEAGSTTEASLNQALELLDREKPIGLVMNKVPRSPLLTLSHGGYYYYAGPDDV